MAKRKLPPDVRKWFQDFARKGGTACAAARTPEERSTAARKAVQARWAKVRAVEVRTSEVHAGEISVGEVRADGGQSQRSSGGNGRLGGKT